MTKTDWFVKLEYGKYNFLISQDIIIEAGDANFDNNEEESFIGNFDVFFPDQVMSKTNNIRLKEFIIHIMQSRKMVISTSVIPSPVQLDLGKLKPLTGILKAAYFKKGLIAVYFENGKIYYLVSPENLFKGTGN